MQRDKEIDSTLLSQKVRGLLNTGLSDSRSPGGWWERLIVLPTETGSKCCLPDMAPRSLRKTFLSGRKDLHLQESEKQLQFQVFFKVKRDVVGREVGGGFMFGNACKNLRF